LKTAVRVAANPDREGYTANQMVELAAGTPLSELAESEKAQLSPDHFADDKGDAPKDWRSKDAQDADRAQAKALEQHRRETTRGDS